MTRRYGAGHQDENAKKADVMWDESSWREWFPRIGTRLISKGTREIEKTREIMGRKSHKTATSDEREGLHRQNVRTL
jgi:hypothetical protein